MDADANSDPGLTPATHPPPVQLAHLDGTDATNPEIQAIQTHSEQTTLPFPAGMSESSTSKPQPVSSPAPRHSSRAVSGTPRPRTRTPKPATPRPDTSSDAVAGTSGAQMSPDVGRPLNVTDALSYLDAVKVQFQEQPEVYNHFLDIMKDFKSQVIDTPGVIQRVSRLFHGNPYLIQGFNTFLPLGYRIEMSADPLDPNTITVTTPMGTTTQNTNSFTRIPRNPSDIPGLNPPNTIPPPPFGGPVPILPPLGSVPLQRSLTPHGYHLTPSQASFDPTYSPGFQNPQTTAAALSLGNLSNRHPVEKQPPGEFNHAIQYLNKIKARYADDTNTYKQFLDILQTYQKEQRLLQDSQVYAQVLHLFKDAPDLLAEFKDFLPDAVAAGAPQTGVVILPHPPGPGGSGLPWTQPDMSTSIVPEKAVKKVIPPLKRKKRPVEKDPTPVPQAKVIPNRTKKVKHHHKPDPGSPSFSPYMGPHSPQAGHLQPHAHSGMQPPMQPPLQHSLALQSQTSYVIGHPANTSADKLLFFDRAKKALENREIYEEFLKLLNLYSKEIIDLKILIERSRVFLRDGDLMTEFKDLVGWDERLENVENGPPGSIRTGPPEALSALPVDDGEGPSYRKLPDSEIRLACSGRDELCRSVLNDEWVSHPTWASEEAGFVAHKKNSFEEALHKSEEERHEYHVHVEALTRTIAILEPLNARIDEMTNEERTLFKLKPDLGGSSKCIYHRIIKKVYGRESGQEVIQALQDCPSVAVPVVLSRLKQKDDEWRRAQREWSRTWREVDSKNFYKSLDHQGISFKANDKKNITAKHFVGDIESIKAEQFMSREQDGVPCFARGSFGHQLEYNFQDTPVLHDSLKMVYSFLDRSQAHYSPQERRGVERFLRLFIPLLCMYPAAEFNAACGPPDGNPDDDINHELSGHSDGLRSGRRSTNSNHSSGIAAGDLRKKLLKTVQEKSTGKDFRGSASVVESRAASPSSAPRSPSSMRPEENATQTSDSPAVAEDVWIRETATHFSGDNPSNGFDSERRPFFANTTFYTLLRLLQLLYSRLLMCRDIGSKLATRKHRSLLANPVAAALGLDDPNGPSVVLAQAMEVLRDHEDANVVYMYLLDACEKVFDGELDQATFEEHMRWFFGNKAYQLFTLDKLITALVKQVQTILSDNKCQELWTLLQRTQNAETMTNQDIIRYRREAERHVGQDDHLYRIQWLRKQKTIRIHLIGSDEPSLDADVFAVSRWREYVHTYVMRYPTEWMPEKKGGTPVYLKRSLQSTNESAVLSTSGMCIRIGLPTYKLVYETGSEDCITRNRKQEEEEMLVSRARARHEERKRSPWIL